MGYTQDWWQRNGGKIAEERRRKYQTDPEHRELVKNRAREYRDRKRAEREAFLKSPTLTIGSVTHPAMTVDALCAFAGIDRDRLKYMQKTGYIPPAVTGRGLRLYTHNQAEMIRELEAFLREHSHHLRMPYTDRGAELTALLHEKTTTIASKWET